MPLGADERTSVPLVRARDEFAPLMRDGFFLVPRLATHDDAGDAS
jgi:aspartyl-tRNA(Asn)/glutamyl-tRNA(Gln) amidotransferase subunit C